MDRPAYFNPMDYINEAVRCFMDEHPVDALAVLQAAQRLHFEWGQYEQLMDAVEDDETSAGVIDELVSKSLRRGGYVPNPMAKGMA